MAELGFFETASTQLQITRYKPDPVPQDAIDKVLEAAGKAPSGLNVQPWEFVVITDRDLIRRVSQIYREAWEADNGAQPKQGESSIYKHARHLAQHMHEVPVLILVCVDHSRFDFIYKPGDPVVRDRYSHSVWPAVQNLFLAARALGLGTRITTNYLSRESELMQLLDIPDHVETVVLTPLGYPEGKFHTPKRRPIAELTSYNRWGNRK